MIWLAACGLAACLLLVALLAASEAALAATNRVRLRHLLRAVRPGGDGAHEAATALSSELSHDAQRFLATVTIAANIPLMVAAVLVTVLSRERWGDGRAAILAIATAALLTIPLFQVTPRLLVSQRGSLERLWWVRPARALVAALRPFVTMLLWLGESLLRPLGLTGSRRRGADANEEEIRDLVEAAQTSGVLQEEGKELIESIFSFGDTRAREVMIPRPDMLALAVDEPAEAVLDALERSGFSRLPLHEGGIDRIVGVLHSKDVLAALGRGETRFSPRDLMRAPLFIPESQPIDEAFATMRAARSHLAIIIDEYGGTAGLLTVEDVLEELVGEIADEHDQRDEALQLLDENSALVNALLHADDLEERWDVALPTGEFDTVGGFMIEQLGRALVVGDRVETDTEVLVVHSVRARRPHKILIRKKRQLLDSGAK
jgi:CBS domain containing-hemolysin-like protein